MSGVAPVISIVDDDEPVRRALARMLAAHGYGVRAYGNADDLLSAARELGPGCLLLDVRLPRVSGLELQEILARRGVECAIVFMTGHSDVHAGVRAMKAGAIDFLIKPFTDEALLAALHRALEQDEAARRLRADRDEILARAARLTRREREVCELVVSGLINKQIAAVIGTTEKTVKVHRARAMAKMGASSLAELVRLVDRITPTHTASLTMASAGDAMNGIPA